VKNVDFVKTKIESSFDFANFIYLSFFYLLFFFFIYSLYLFHYLFIVSLFIPKDINLYTTLKICRCGPNTTWSWWSSCFWWNW